MQDVAEVNALRLAELLELIAYTADTTVPDAVDVYKNEPAALTAILRTLREAITFLKDSYQVVEDALVEAMPSKEMEIPGIGVIQRRSGTARKSWDHQALWRDVTQVLLSDSEGPEDFVARLRTVVTPSWKVTGLRPLGIDPDEYCEVSYGRRTVQLP